MKERLQRADAALAAALGTSRAEARRILERGPVELDGVSRRLAKGALIPTSARVNAPSYRPASDRRPLPEPQRPLRLLGRGAGWIAVDKPAGCAVHPQREEERGTLLNALIAREPALQGVGEGGLRSGVVHRLDLATSGAVLFATDQATFRALREAFSRHRVRKLYRAVVAGHIAEARTLELPLRVAVHKPARVRVAASVAEAGARLTRLAYRPVRALSAATEVEVDLATGHLHQIRVSMAHLGHPVLGDPIYGCAASAARLMLHAGYIALEDGPFGSIAVASPVPADFAAARRALQQDAACTP